MVAQCLVNESIGPSHFTDPRKLRAVEMDLVLTQALEPGVV